MRNNSDENVEENKFEFQEKNTLEKKRYFIDMSYFWNVVGSSSTVDITSSLENLDINKKTDFTQPYVGTGSIIDITPILLNSNSVLSNKIVHPLVASDSKMDNTTNLLDTDVVKNNEIDFVQPKEIPLSRLPELQEKDNDTQLVLLMEQIEKIGKQIGKNKRSTSSTNKK
jgi:hypothetical protein